MERFQTKRNSVFRTGTFYVPLPEMPYSKAVLAFGPATPRGFFIVRHATCGTETETYLDLQRDVNPVGTIHGCHGTREICHTDGKRYHLVLANDADEVVGIITAAVVRSRRSSSLSLGLSLARALRSML